ncbi:hypothetical protein ACMFMF_002794 [Clarireedia jacksonii]
MSDCPAFPFPRRHGIDPAPENAELRRKFPVSQVQLFDGSKAWLVTKHKDCRQVLESRDFSADRRKDAYPEIHPGGKVAALASAPTFVNLDDPEHDEQRKRTQAAFTPSAIAKLRPLIQHFVDTAIDQLIAKGCADGPVDLIHNIAAPIPTKTVYHILGIPEEDIEALAYDSEVRNSTSRNAAENANTNLQSYMVELTEKKMRNPGNDLISELISQYQSGTGTKADISSLAYLVLVAGNAAVVNTIALGVLTLHQHPSQLEELKNDPSLAPKVVDEIFRYQTTSALNCRRVAVRDVEVGGVKIPQNTGIICAVQAADRDEEFPQPSSSDPETFDIHRGHDIKDVLGFGWGIHRCQAEWLSKAELECVFGMFYFISCRVKMINRVREMIMKGEFNIRVRKEEVNDLG